MYAPLADFAYAWFAGDDLAVREVRLFPEHGNAVIPGPSGPMARIASLSCCELGNSVATSSAKVRALCSPFRPLSQSKEISGWE